MDYPLENLGPERFQELCQALLTKEFPNIQCFPVAQPDGGRDAISYTVEEPGRGFIMYQIKYVRNPQAEEDPHQWLTKIMQLEAIASVIQFAPCLFSERKFWREIAS